MADWVNKKKHDSTILQFGCCLNLLKDPGFFGTFWVGEKGLGMNTLYIVLYYTAVCQGIVGCTPTNVPCHGKSLYKPYIVGIYGL